jgi:hypothetical protein
VTSVPGALQSMEFTVARALRRAATALMPTLSLARARLVPDRRRACGLASLFRTKNLWEPVCRLTRQSIRSNAASTLRALVAGQLLTQHRERNVERGWWQFIMLDPIGDHFDGESLRVADGSLAPVPVTHNARQFQSLGNPAAVIFPVEFDGKVHRFIVRLASLGPC